MDQQDAEALLNQTQRLACGLLFETPERQTHGGGSAMFIAPRLALTARHVTDEGFKLGDQRRPVRVGEAKAKHGIRLFQQSNNRDPPHGLWSADYFWRTTLTDISLLSVSESPCSPDPTLPMPTDFLPWRVLPPPVGERVRLLGYPLSEWAYDDDCFTFKARRTPCEATITANYSPYRDLGMYDFPCFEIAIKVDHGFSGGGVLWEGNLCGIVSGDSFGDRALVAALWPLCMMDLRPRAVNSHSGMADLLDAGFIRSDDWLEARARMGIREFQPGKHRAVLADGWIRAR